MQSKNIGALSFLCVALSAIPAAAAIACVYIVVLQSADAERLYRTWQFSRFLFFSSLCLFFALSLTLDAISRHALPARSMTVSRKPNRISMLLVFCAMAVVLLYPARPFVYLENGHWINRSKAGTWEVSQATAIDSYKHNIIWNCVLVFSTVGGLVSIAVTLSRTASPAKSQ
jgi:hypothetical protein